MKRGQSGYSFIVGIDKEAGHSSHSALSYIKRTLGERRIGHAGTLDPFATGVLVAMIGPAARLNRYIACDEKTYLADIVFGRSTATDDVDGPTLGECPIPASLYDADHAIEVLAGFTGEILQRPPVYSAIKRDGKRSYEQARRGHVIDIEPRLVRVLAADLIAIDTVDDDGREVPRWRVAFDVSKGTYIRSLARDMGIAAGTCAHLGALRRTCSGKVQLDDCVAEGSDAATLIASSLDPVRLLGMRVIFVEGDVAEKVGHGNPVRAKGLDVFGYSEAVSGSCDCCSSPFYETTGELDGGERIAMIDDRGLKAVYAYDDASGMLTADCVFQKEVSRGPGIIF